jgi:hypothetical protein
MMTDFDDRFYDVTDISDLLKTSPNNIPYDNNGIELPPSVKIGKRRLWRKKDYREWADGLFNKSSNDNTPNNQNKEAS